MYRNEDLEKLVNDGYHIAIKIEVYVVQDLFLIEEFHVGEI